MPPARSVPTIRSPARAGSDNRPAWGLLPGGALPPIESAGTQPVCHVARIDVKGSVGAGPAEASRAMDSPPGGEAGRPTGPGDGRWPAGRHRNVKTSCVPVPAPSHLPGNGHFVTADAGPEPLLAAGPPDDGVRSLVILWNDSANVVDPET